MNDTLIMLTSPFEGSVEVVETRFADIKLDGLYVSWLEPQPRRARYGSVTYDKRVRVVRQLDRLIAIVPRSIGGDTFKAIREAATS